MKLAFFDMDGTLCSPQYLVDGKLEIGLPEGWVEYCVEKGSDTYEDCKPVRIVGDYARKLKEDGRKLYVLSTVQTSFEYDAKKSFLDQHYPGLFEALLTVSQDEYKWKVITKMAEKMHVGPEDCELVEDTYLTLIEAAGRGIKATHISSLMSD
jgi:FMN phosphatase YigB (HAD superfamily)